MTSPNLVILSVMHLNLEHSDRHCLVFAFCFCFEFCLAFQLVHLTPFRTHRLKTSTHAVLHSSDG